MKHDPFSALQARLRSIPAAIARAAAAETSAAANRAADRARGLVPVDTGALKSSIRAGAISGTCAAVSAGTDHAAMVEFGTSQMPAQPYLLPAAQAEAAIFFESAKAAALANLKEAKA